MAEDRSPIHREKLDFERLLEPPEPPAENGVRFWVDDTPALRALDHTGADVSPESGPGDGYAPGGTDVAVADGGTGASNAAGARTNLGVAAAAHTHAKTRAIEFIIDGAGSAIAAGIKGDVEVPFACTIVAWRMLADQAGSITVGIWRDTYANFPPVVGDLLVSPALSSAAKAEATGLSHALAAGDILRYNANATPATVTRVTVSLTVTVDD